MAVSMAYVLFQGTNLNSASTEKEVTVLIGSEPCSIKSLSFSQLLCKPPEKQPPGSPNKDSLPIVKVSPKLHRAPTCNDGLHVEQWSQELAILIQ